MGDRFIATATRQKRKPATRTPSRTIRKKDPTFLTGLSGTGPYGANTSGFQWITNPSDQQMLTAYGHSPWAHVKFLRLCSSIAMLEKLVKARKPNGESVELPETYPLTQLIRNPNPVLTEWDFDFLTELYARVTGEVFWRIKRNGLGVPESIWVYPKFWVRANRDPNSRVLQSYTVATSPSETVPVKDMIWLHTPAPLDPYARGLGSMLSTATEMETFEYASEADKNFFLRDATPQGVLKTPGSPNKETRDQMAEEWRRRYGSFKNYGEIAILWGGLEFEKIRENRKDMDFIQGQKWLRDVIIAGVHPHILGISEGVNRAQAEAAEYTFARWEVLPRARWNADVRNRYLAAQFDSRVFIEYQNVVPQDSERLIKTALDERSGEILTVDQRLVLLAQATGQVIKPVGGTYGSSYVLPLNRMTQTIAEVDTPTSPTSPANPDTGADDLEDEPAAPDKPASGRMVTTARSFTAKLTDEEAKKLAAEFTRKQHTPSLSDLVVLLGLPNELAQRLWRYLGGAYEAVMEGRYGEAADEIGLTDPFSVTDPEVVRFLQEASGARVRGISETLLRALRTTLAEGVDAGESIPQLARRVAATFEDAKGWRAELIARTETLAASNRAAFIAYQEAGVQSVEWLLAPDYTPEVDRGECEPFDGKIIPLGEEFAPGIFYPPLHPGCLIPGQQVVAPRILTGFERAYAGPVVTIQTRGGHRLTVTPNHPLLTPKGWVAAGSLNEGDDLIRSLAPERMLTGDPHAHHIPSAIEQVTQSLRGALGVVSMTMPVTAEDFHGDGKGSDVCVIRTHSLLKDVRDSSNPQGSRQPQLSLGSVSLGALAASGRSVLLTPRDTPPTNGRVGRFGVGAPFSGSATRLLDPVALGDASHLDSGITQGAVEPLARMAEFSSERVGGLSEQVAPGDAFGDRLPPLGANPVLTHPPVQGLGANSEFAHEFSGRFPGLIATDEIIEVRKHEFAGHVYNLETAEGWYVAEGIITHNCRCTIAPVIEDETARRGLYVGEHRKAHITALGQRHARYERSFKSALLRGLQEYQNEINRGLRALA